MMQPEMQSMLDAYVMVFDEIKQVVKNESVAAVILQEVARDRRAQQIRDEREAARQSGSSSSNGEPATAKQIDFLKDLGMPVPKGLTKQAASDLIDQGAAKRRAQ